MLTTLPKGIFDERFEILEKLGEGASGAVYKAQQLGLDRLVALKVLNLSTAPRAGERFKREAQALLLLDTPGFSNFLGYGFADDLTPYIWMEFVEGPSLEAVLKRQGTLNPSDVATLGQNLCAALDTVHSKGIIHRDLKPSNIIVKENFDVTVLDFGLASMLSSDSPDSVKLTAANHTVGTPRYMSPEQCAHLELDERSDLYSIGAILYECAVGRPAFNDTNFFTLMYSKCHLAPPSLTAEVLPENLTEAITRALQTKPADRFGSVSELSSRLANLSPARRENVHNSSHLSIKTISIACSVCALIAPLAGWTFWRWIHPAPIISTATLAPAWQTRTWNRFKWALNAIDTGNMKRAESLVHELKQMAPTSNDRRYAGHQAKIDILEAKLEQCKHNMAASEIHFQKAIAALETGSESGDLAWLNIAKLAYACQLENSDPAKSRLLYEQVDVWSQKNNFEDLHTGVLKGYHRLATKQVGQ